MRHLLLPGFLLLAALCSFALAEAPRPPRELPAFSATDTLGNPVDLTALRGSVVLLNAWATWCTPCRREIPFLSALQSREAARGLQVVGVSVDEAADREAVLAAVPQLGIRYPVWLDPAGRVSELVHTTAVPASVLIDRDGTVRWRHVGLLRQQTPGFAEALAAALDQP